MNANDTSSRILLVEDNEFDRGELAEALKARGYEVVAVSSALDALDYLRWRVAPPACVVLDMRLPVMTGWEFRKVLAEDSTLRNLPLIGVTAGGWKEGDEGEFAALISKPIRVEELVEAVKHAVGRRG